MKSISCPLCCNSTFANQNDLKAHLMKVTNNIRCSMCVISFSNVASLIDHLDHCKGNAGQVSLRSRRRSRIDSPSCNNDSSRENFITKRRYSTPSVASVSSVHYREYNSVHRRYNGGNTNGQNFIPKQEVFDENDDDVLDFPDDKKIINETPNSNIDEPVVNDDNQICNVEDKLLIKNDEGFFCTQCQLVLPDVDDHVQKFHHDTEVVFQLEDYVNLNEDYDEVFSEFTDTDYGDYSNDDGGVNGDSSVVETSFTTNRKRLNENGPTPKRGRPPGQKRRKINDDTVNAITNGEGNDKRLFCTVCHESFDPSEDHAKRHHDHLKKLIVQDIHETLFMSPGQNVTLNASQQHADNNNTVAIPDTFDNVSDSSYFEERTYSTSIRGRRSFRGGRGNRGRKRNTSVAVHEFTATSPAARSRSKSLPPITTNQSSTLPTRRGRPVSNAGIGERTVDGEEEPVYECGDCNRRFTDKFFLTEHITRHVMDNSITCPYCDRIFNSVANVLNHTQIHLKDDSSVFHCGDCEQKFKYASGLIVHSRILGHSIVCR